VPAEVVIVIESIGSTETMASRSTCAAAPSVIFYSAAGTAGAVLTIDCSELSADEKLALASAISDALEGRVLALVQLDGIAIDRLTDERVGVEDLQPIVSDFVSRRKNAQYYSIEVRGEKMVVHSADPVAAASRKTENALPPNLRQCPYCSFLTEYEVEYNVHLRSHLFGV